MKMKKLITTIVLLSLLATLVLVSCGQEENLDDRIGDTSSEYDVSEEYLPESAVEAPESYDDIGLDVVSIDEVVSEVMSIAPAPPSIAPPPTTIVPPPVSRAHVPPMSRAPTPPPAPVSRASVPPMSRVPINRPALSPRPTNITPPRQFSTNTNFDLEIYEIIEIVHHSINSLPADWRNLVRLREANSYFWPTSECRCCQERFYNYAWGGFMIAPIDVRSPQQQATDLVDYAIRRMSEIASGLQNSSAPHVYITITIVDLNSNLSVMWNMRRS